MDIAKEDEDLEKYYRYTEGTKGSLAKVGWYKIPKKWFQSKEFQEFWDWYGRRGKPERTKKNNTRNMIKLLYKMCKGTREQYSPDIITEKNFSDACRHLLDNGVTYETIYNYYKSFVHFVDKFGRKKYLKLRTKEGDHIARSLELEMLDIEDIGKLYQTKSMEQRKLAKSLQQMPPTPYEVNEVMRVGRKAIDKLLTKGEDKELTRDETCHINRYLICHVVLTLANRPCVIEHLTITAFEHALHNCRLSDEHGESVMITVVQPKTADSFVAHIPLEGYMLDFWERYAMYVRYGIVRRTRSMSDAFFLQNDGKPFLKISDAPKLLQQRFVCPAFNNNDARKSYETYIQEASSSQQSDMAEFLCHSVTTRDKVYRKTSMMKSLGAYRMQRRMVDYYSTHNRGEIPNEFPLLSSAKKEPEENEGPSPSKRTRSIRKEEKEESMGCVDEAGVCKGEGTSEDREIIKRKVIQRPPKPTTVPLWKQRLEKSPIKGTHSSPKTKNEKAIILKDYLVDKYGSLADAHI